MENNNTNYIQKPIFDGELESAEYEAVVVKATPMEAKGTMPASIRVMFKIEFPTCVAFVSGFINQTFKSGDKTSNWLKNLGVATMDNRVPVEQLKGKKCRIYVVPGKKACSVKLGKEIQYHKILSLTPMNKVILLNRLPRRPLFKWFNLLCLFNNLFNRIRSCNNRLRLFDLYMPFRKLFMLSLCNNLRFNQYNNLR